MAVNRNYYDFPPYIFVSEAVFDQSLALLCTRPGAIAGRRQPESDTIQI
jgi:hypothetical protein